MSKPFSRALLLQTTLVYFDQNQQLLVRFTNLSNNYVIISWSVCLAFEIEITSKDDNAIIYQNLGRVIIKKTTIRIVVIKACPLMIAIFITDALTCGKALQNDLQWLIKVLAKTTC